MMNKKTIQFTVVILISFNFWIWYSLLGVQSIQNAVYFLNVGQGDSQLITLSSGHGALPIKILIDGGRDKKVLDALDGALGMMNNKYIDIVVVSHPELDHFGGIIEVIKRYDVGLLVSNGLQTQTDAFGALQKEIAMRDIQTIVLREGDRIRYQNNNFFVFSPDRTLAENKNLNEASLVMMLEAGRSRTLFTGDTGFLAENVLLAKRYNLQADILKVGHHGSKYSSGDNFISAVRPTISIIGVGQNRYGHPAPRVLEILELAGSKLYRTDKDGTIKVVLDEKNVSGARLANVSKFAEIVTGAYKSQGITTLSLSEMQKEYKKSRLVPYTRCVFRSEKKTSRAPIIINEVAWMGSLRGFTHEWIELRNISGGAIDISGWQVINENDKIHITFPQQSVFDGQFIVLARNAANDALKLGANITFTGSIRNSNDGLRLFDNNCALIDEALVSPSWPAGNNKTKQTMERKGDLEWASSMTPGGTPGQENSW